MESRPRMKYRMFGYNIRDKMIRNEKLGLVTEKLRNDMYLNILRLEASGANGHVIAATTSSNEDIAIKIMTKNNISEGEDQFWQKIKHKNLLTMMEWQHFPDLDVHLFISPLHCCNLGEILKAEVFLKCTEGLKVVKKWLRDTLSAVSYLQNQGFCHLAIKPSSILISCDQDAVLCDFHCMGKTDEPTKRYALTYRDRPPEVCTSLNEKQKIATDGIAFDAWSIGILALKVFTGEYVKEKIPVIFDSWIDGVYPHLFNIFQKKLFIKKCRAAFPACEVGEETALVMMNFITSCLKLSPEDRPCAAALTEHKYMDNMGFMQEPDSIWKRNNKKEISKIKSFSKLGGGDASEHSMDENTNQGVPRSELPSTPQMRSLETAPLKKHGRFCKIRRWLQRKTALFRRQRT